MTRSRLYLIIALSASACSNQASHPEPTPTPETYAKKLLGGLDQGNLERTRGDMLTIATALRSYSSSNDLPDTASIEDLSRLLTPAYVRQIRTTDAWGHTFAFQGNMNGWSLTAPGPDGAVGTGDDVVLSDAGWTKLPDGYTER